MARRIKEEPIVHQKRIAKEAMMLFAKKGIESTKMDEIAEKAGYSKATLYVYFKNKEDIVSFLSLESMLRLKSSLSDALSGEASNEEKFYKICQSLVKYQKDYPDFFSLSLKYITFDFKEGTEWDRQTYEIGEEINQMIFKYLEDGIKQGEFITTVNYFATIFQMWGMLSGIIILASEKEKYIEKAGKITKSQFLEEGFGKIYQTIKRQN